MTDNTHEATQTVEDILKELETVDVQEADGFLTKDACEILTRYRDAILTQERTRLKEEILPRVQKFIDKVESGRARSKETYADMLAIRDLLAKTNTKTV